MKKFCGLKLFGLVVILAIVFVFIGFNFVQGQVKTSGKPDKPPKGEQYTWKAVILDTGVSSIMGVGDPSYIPETGQYGWHFSDSDPNINVRVEKKRLNIHGDYKYCTRFYIEIFEKEQIDFDFPFYSPVFDTDPPYQPRCLYPGGIYPEDNPHSMFHFMMNESHPHPSYHWMGFRFSTGASANQDEIDIEQWTDQVLSEFHFRIEGPAPQYPCVESELFEYSNIIGYAGDTILAADYGFFERIQENYDNIDIWKATVGMGRDGTEYMGDGFYDGDGNDFYYICEEVPFNKKKTYVDDRAINSAYGRWDMQFEILFIRTKI
jgi:hypothetical protein